MPRIFYAIIMNLILLAALAVTASAQADKPTSEIEVNGIYTIPSGSVNLSGTTTAGTTIDFKNDFDLRNKWGYGLKYIYRTENGKHKLWATYTHTSNTSTRALTRTIVFENQVYTANLNTKSDTSLGMFL